MPQPFKAWIIPIEGDAPGGGQPPGIWGPNDPRPQPPIPVYPGGTPNPPGIWGPNDPRPGWGLPGNPGGGTGQPPGIWGGGNVPMPNPPIYLPPEIHPQPPQGAHPEHPIYWPPTPTHPIVIPDPPTGQPPDLKPEHPIVIPPPSGGSEGGVEWDMVFVPANNVGWVWALVPKGDSGIAQPKEGEKKKGGMFS